MKKRGTCIIALLLCLLMVFSTPAAAMADVTDAETTAEAAEDTGTLDETAQIDEASAEEASDSSEETEQTDEEATAEEEAESDTAEENNTVTSAEEEEEVVIGEDTVSSAAQDAASDTSADDTAGDSAAVTVTGTQTTYSLSIKVSTKAVSSSNKTLKKITISAPVMTTTVTTSYSDGTTSTSSSSVTYEMTVKYSVRTSGWKKASQNSSGSYVCKASDASDGKYIQAVRIIPSSELKAAMKQAGVGIYYRATSKYFGKLGWASAGKIAGSTGNNTAMTAFKLKVYTTEEAAALDTDNNYISATSVSYRTRTSGSSSWSSAKKNGATSGTAKSTASSIGSLRAQIKLANSGKGYSGGIKYSIRTSSSDDSSNWSEYTSDDGKAGTKNSKIKAIKVKLTGEMAEKFDVYYRVYVKGYGWLGWASNGQKAGTKGSDYNISAIQIKLVPTGSSAPGSTNKHFVSTVDAKTKMILKAQSFSSSTKYLILVDRANCKVGIFTGSKNNWTLKYYWDCCVGKSSTPTISGTYSIGSKGYSFGEDNGYSCYYYSQISGNYLFHSVLYYPNTRTVKDGTMGKAVSHGCVRLTISHAKWIYDNVGRGSTVHIY